MIRNTLYTNLIRGIYALDGQNGEFLGALARPIPFVPTRAKDWPEAGVLALIPAHREDAPRMTAQGILNDLLAALDS